MTSSRSGSRVISSTARALAANCVRVTGKREVTSQLLVKIDLPGYQLTYAARAAVLGQLGEWERAKDQLSQLIALRQTLRNRYVRSSASGISPILSSLGLKVCAKRGWRFRKLRKKIRSKLPAALSPSPSPWRVIGIEPETSTLYFPCSGAVQF